MEMTIDKYLKETNTVLITKDAFEEMKNIMRKYQEIEELVNGWDRYRKGLSSSVGDSGYMQMVREVVDNG